MTKARPVCCLEAKPGQEACDLPTSGQRTAARQTRVPDHCLVLH